VGFIIMSTKPGNLIDLTIADRTADIVLSLFLLCSLSGIIGAIFYETVWVAIPRYAYMIKAILAALTGVFVANVVSAAGHDIALTIVISLLGEKKNVGCFHDKQTNNPMTVNYDSNDGKNTSPHKSTDIPFFLAFIAFSFFS
jgi:hypothetical protein